MVHGRATPGLDTDSVPRHMSTEMREEILAAVRAEKDAQLAQLREEQRRVVAELRAEREAALEAMRAHYDGQLNLLKAELMLLVTAGGQGGAGAAPAL